MTFDKWIDSVNDQVRGRLGDRVRTEELSWDSAMWVGQNGTAVATMTDDEQQASWAKHHGTRNTETARICKRGPAVAGMTPERLSIQSLPGKSDGTQL